MCEHEPHISHRVIYGKIHSDKDRIPKKKTLFSDAFCGRFSMGPDARFYATYICLPRKNDLFVVAILANESMGRAKLQ